MLRSQRMQRNIRVIVTIFDCAHAAAMIHARHWGSAADPDTENFSALEPWPAPLVLEFDHAISATLALFASNRLLNHRNRVLLCALLRFRERDLRNRRQLHFDNLVGQVFEMDAPNPTCPDYADSDFSAYGKHLLIPL